MSERFGTHHGEIDRVADRGSELHEWMATAPQVYRGALDGAVQHQLAAPADGQLETWRPVGPRNVGGAIRSIVQDPRTPTTFYAGSAQGGVWKTEDDGYFWRPVSPPGMLVPVAALAIAPSNSRVLYAGTGDTIYGALAGRGIWRSGDAGATWAQMVGPPPVAPPPPPVPAGAANQYARILVDPVNANRFWAASDRGLWRHDPGPGFAQEAGALPAGPVTDIAMIRDPADPANRLILLAGVAGVGIFRGVFNRPGAATVWAPVVGAPAAPPANFGRIRVAFSGTNAANPIHRAYAVMEDLGIAGAAAQRTPTGVYTSLDAGVNWAGPGPQPEPPAAGDPAGQAWYSMCLAVHPANPQLIFVGYVDLNMSANGGGAWTKALNWFQYDNGDHAQHADQHDVRFDVRNPNTVWVCNDGGISVAPDITTSVGPRPPGPGWWGPAPAPQPLWRKKSFGVSGAQFVDVTTHPSFPWMFGGGMQDNGTWVSYGGPSWYVLDGADGGQLAFDPASAHQFWASWQGGIDRTVIGPPATPPPQYSTILPDRAAPANVMVPTFTPLAFPAANAATFIGVVEADAANTGQLLIGRRGGGFYVRDGTNSRLMNTAGVAAGTRVSATAIVPAAPREYWLGTSAGQLFHLSGTPPNAAAQPAWNVVTPPWGGPPPPPPPIASIAVHPTNPAIVAISSMSQPGRVFLTHNRGVDPAPADPTRVAWREITAGLPPGPITSVAFDPTSPQVLFAGTLAGVYVARNLPAFSAATNSPAAGAVAWSTYNQGLPPVQVNDLHVVPVRNTLRCGTHARGCFEVNIRGATPAAFQIPTVRLSLRSHVTDDSYTYPPANITFDDPRVPIPGAPPVPATAYNHTQAFDIRVDSLSLQRSEAFAFGETIDGAEFDEQLVPDPPAVGQINHVYVQVQNRGSAVANNPTVHLYFADASGASPGDPPVVPPIDAAFNFPGDPGPASPWRRVGPAQTLGFVDPGQPEVVQFTWIPPIGIRSNVALLGIVTGAEDPVTAPAAGDVVATYVGGERRAALRVSAVRRDPIYIRDTADDRGDRGSSAWGGRSPDIVLRPPGSPIGSPDDPNGDLKDLGDAHLGDRVQAGTNLVYVRVHNPTQVPVEVDVQLWQIPIAEPAPGTGWAAIGGGNVHVAAVPAGGWNTALFTWTGVADPGPAAFGGRGFALLALARVVDAAGNVLDDFPDKADVTDVESFWTFMTRGPVANNAALRAVRWLP